MKFRGGIPHTALQLNVSEVRIHSGKLSGATSSSKIEEVNLVYLKKRRYMTKIFYGLPICLAQAGLVCIEVVINVEFSGNSKLVIDSASFKQLMDMEDEY